MAAIAPGRSRPWPLPPSAAPAQPALARRTHARRAPDCPRASRLLASLPKGKGKGRGERGVSDTDITRLLALARDGEPAQLGVVFEALYPELRRLATSRMYGNVSTFTPTVLVHELFRSEEHTSELQSLMRISYAVFCLKKKQNHQN